MHSKGNWLVVSGEVVSDEVGSVLLAARDNPRTLPTERDSNILLAAKAKGMFEAIILFLAAKDDLEKHGETTARILQVIDCEMLLALSIDDRSVRC